MNIIEENIKSHVFMIKDSFNIENNKIVSVKNKYASEYAGFESYANSNNQTRSIFACTDESILIKIYKEKIKYVCDLINSVTNNDMEKLICTMEFMRLMVTYEFICAPGNENNETIKNSSHTFSGSGLNAAITGRGICQSQASFCRDILNELGIDARFYPLHGSNGSHADVLVENQGILDPTNYIGSINTLAGGHLFKEYGLEGKFSDFNFLDKSVFEDCKSRFQKELIKSLGIDKISELLGFDKLSQDDKQFAIWYLITKNIEILDLPINSTTVNVTGNSIEISNLLELFYIANNIPFERAGIVKGKFEHEYYSVYKTVIKDKKVKIIPRFIMGIKPDKTRGLTPIFYDESFSNYEVYTDDFIRVKQVIDGYGIDINNIFQFVSDSSKLTELSQKRR